MKNQKRLIYILLLIAIIVGIFVLSRGGYFSIKQYQNNQTISASELIDYLSGVVEIRCGDRRGSGILWVNNEIHSVLTNEHVVSSLPDTESCVVNIGGEARDGLSKIYETVSVRHAYRWNEETDIVVLPLIERGILQQKGGYTPVLERQTVPLKELNYGISLMARCATDMPLGSPVVIVGYPVSTVKSIETEKWVFFESSQTVTDGIISALEDLVSGTFGNQIHPNYFISAKIDSGNSGGVALSKDEKGLCVLGVPTWLAVGNYETQGVVQNIHNVLYQR